jgi:hypothetical protein
MFNLSGTTGGNEQYENVFPDVFHKFNVEAPVCTIFVITAEYYLSSSWVGLK